MSCINPNMNILTDANNNTNHFLFFLITSLIALNRAHSKTRLCIRHSREWRIPDFSTYMWLVWQWNTDSMRRQLRTCDHGHEMVGWGAKAGVPSSLQGTSPKSPPAATSTALDDGLPSLLPGGSAKSPLTPSPLPPTNNRRCGKVAKQVSIGKKLHESKRGNEK
jgi:hypothetical protein